MTNFKNTAEIGDTIRSFDFKPMPGRNDSYVEGVVVDKGITKNGFMGFTVKVTKRVFGDIVDEILSDNSKEIMAPFEMSFLDWDARIQNISK
tara:strand:+ start:6050 stop:6325 length:276 start_codon:yes stop_codon:yes gene_type:complete